MGATPRACRRDHGSKAQQPLPAGNQSSPAHDGNLPPRGSSRRGRADLSLRAQSGASPEPEDHPSPHRGGRSPGRVVDEGRRTQVGSADESGDRAGAAVRSRSHRRRIRPQPRSGDRKGTADGGGHRIQQPGDRGCRRTAGSQRVLPDVREHGCRRYRVRRRAQEPDRGGDRDRRRCRVRREHESLDHHPGPRGDDGLRRRAGGPPGNAAGARGTR